MSINNPPFKAALLIVDFQEDFCPPNGSLAVPSGRTIADPINSLLALPWTLRIATKDMHPPTHISFASNHSPPNNKPFESSTTIHNPYNSEETQTTRLWPVHCVQGTPGSALIPELDVQKIDAVVEKGQDERVEMYSAFGSPFEKPKVAESGLSAMLREKGVTHVFCVGLAADYCVKCTAVDAVKEGFETVVVRECTRGVEQGEEADRKLEEELKEKGVKMVGIDGPEVKRVRELR